MHIHCIGLNHNTANIDLRERLAFPKQRVETALARIGCGFGSSPAHIQEIVILSTCNRVELYVVAAHEAFDAIEGFLSETSGVPADEFSAQLYRLLDDDVVTHLMRVAAGLNSLVLGEPQILGQVTDAFSLARGHGTAGKILSRLFQCAIHAGKRARTETMISQNPASVASVAIKLISEIVPRFENSQIVMLGAGETIELAVEALIKRGAKQIQVVNRTLERAQALATRWGSEAYTFEMLSGLIPETDILITSTGAPHTIIHKETITPALDDRPERPLVIMDIAVPRDVDVAVADIPGVTLYDMDSLSTGLEESLSKRRAEVPQVENILDEGVTDFMNYLTTLDVVPIIVEMRRQANTIRENELAKTILRMPDLPPDAQQHIDALTKSIVQKILHSPTIRLREVAGSPNASDYANITRGLFGLD